MKFNLYIFQPVYTETEETKLLPRSSSAPDLTMYRKEPAPELTRKRAYSEVHNIQLSGLDGHPILHASSDTELDKIDKKKSFATADGFRQTTDLLAKVVTALATVKPPVEDGAPGQSGIYGGYHGFSDSEILNGEMPKKRDRARSDFNLQPNQPRGFMQQNEWTWSGDNNQIQEAINNRHKQDARSLVQMPSDDFTIKLEDGEAYKPRTKKFSVPDGLRRLFGSRKNSSKELFSEKKSISHDRKFSVVSVPETQLHNNRSGEQTPLPEQGSREGVPSLMSMYQRQLGSPLQGSSGNLSRKRRESLYTPNAALSSRRSSMFTPNNMNNKNINNNRSPRTSGNIPPPRSGSLFPAAAQSRRPSLFSDTSEDERNVLENTTLADLIRALEIIHTQVVLDKGDKPKTKPNVELGGIFGIDENQLSNTMTPNKAKEMLSKRRATVVGLAPLFLPSATASPVRRRRMGEVKNPQKDVLDELSTSTNASSQVSIPGNKFSRRFSVRPTALPILPDEAAPANAELKVPSSSISQLSGLAAVKQRRTAQRPSPLAQERAELSSNESLTTSSTLDIPTSRLLPTRTTTNTSSSTFSPLSRIVQLSQASQRKNSTPEKPTNSSLSKDNNGFDL